MSRKKSNAGRDSAPPVALDEPNPPAFAWVDPEEPADRVLTDSEEGQGGRPSFGSGPKLKPPDEPAWAATVREPIALTAPTGPPPLEVPDELSRRMNCERPFVELTLIHTGRYTGPVRGRMMEEAHSGFMLLTEKDGVFFVPWSNLAFWRFLPEF